MADQDSEIIVPTDASGTAEHSVPEHRAPKQRTPEQSSAGSGEEQERLAAPPSAAGTSYCVRCGGSMPGEDRYCRTCGWEMGVEPPPPPPRGVIPNASEKNRLTALLLCIFIGVCGAHRFYVGKVGTGILWLCTFGLFTIGAIYDLALIATGEFRDSDGRKIVYWQY